MQKDRRSVPKAYITKKKKAKQKVRKWLLIRKEVTIIRKQLVSGDKGRALG